MKSQMNLFYLSFTARPPYQAGCVCSRSLHIIVFIVNILHLIHTRKCVFFYAFVCLLLLFLFIVDGKSVHVTCNVFKVVSCCTTVPVLIVTPETGICFVD